MNALLGNSAPILLPSAPGPPPVLNMEASALNVFRQKLLALTSIAGLAGLPQVSMLWLQPSLSHAGLCTAAVPYQLPATHSGAHTPTVVVHSSRNVSHPLEAEPC